jgi:hypothetical protein
MKMNDTTEVMCKNEIELWLIVVHRQCCVFVSIDIDHCFQISVKMSQPIYDPKQGKKSEL